MEVALPRHFSPLNMLSLLLLVTALFLPAIPSIIVLLLSILIQAAFFRVMYRDKVGVNKLLRRIGFMLTSAAILFIVLFQNNLL